MRILFISLFFCSHSNGLIRVPLVRNPNAESPSLTELEQILREKYLGQNQFWNQKLSGFIGKQWYVTLSVGSGGEQFNVLMDTGSSFLWVPCYDCAPTDYSCQAHQQYNCAKSTSCVNPKKTFTSQFDSSTVSGSVYQDKICLSGHCCPGLSFGCSVVEPNSIMMQQYDGVLGLPAPKASSAISQGNALECLFGSQCSNKVFGFYLNRDVSATELSPGEVTFCGIDSSHYSGSIHWTSLSNSARWQLPVQQICLGSRQIHINFHAVIQTGVKFITGPAPYINEINKALGSTMQGNLHVVDCKKIQSFPDVTISIGGVAYTFTYQDYIFVVNKWAKKYCQSLFVPANIKSSDGYLWVVGDVFISKYYTVYDYGNSRIGFANAKY